MEEQPTQQVPSSQPAQEAQDADISKQTLVILVILSCVISVVGVITMIYQFSNVHAAPVTQSSVQTVGQTSFTLLPNGNEPANGKSATGFVALKINKP